MQTSVGASQQTTVSGKLMHSFKSQTKIIRLKN